MKRQTFTEYSRVILVSLAITFITAIFGVFQFYLELKTESVSVKKAYENFPVIVIDAGHGGEDGGAVGKNGVLEKDINLSIARHLNSLFSLTDIRTVMTRNDDIMLYKSGQEHRKKFNDLNNRLVICNSVENPLLVSLHQNKFPLEKYKGLQVWYSSNSNDSKMLADLVQSKTKEYLQRDNNRNIKEAGKNIFILDKAKCPAILVECGFLSNSEEEKLLCDESYQRKIAFIIFSSVLDYIVNYT